MYCVCINFNVKYLEKFFFVESDYIIVDKYGRKFIYFVVVC